ncbi:Sec-independent protein translocase subunit TatA [Phytomonospora sp. NPDC050363]|uniref:Sec-independent protein translocase subunit TatA n=1 Tax=Phytomonospora sp. NPDC050363 TaxID=3155642 RepID=UPI0033EEF774
MFNALKPWHIAVLVVVLILLFGAKKLPDAARGLGRSLRILKAETKNLRDEAKADDKTDEMDSKADAQHTRKPATIEGEALSQPSRDKTHEDGR